MDNLNIDKLDEIDHILSIIYYENEITITKNNYKIITKIMTIYSKYLSAKNIKIIIDDEDLLIYDIFKLVKNVYIISSTSFKFLFENRTSITIIKSNMRYLMELIKNNRNITLNIDDHCFIDKHEIIKMDGYVDKYYIFYDRKYNSNVKISGISCNELFYVPTPYLEIIDKINCKILNVYNFNKIPTQICNQCNTDILESLTIDYYDTNIFLTDFNFQFNNLKNLDLQINFYPQEQITLKNLLNTIYQNCPVLKKLSLKTKNTFDGLQKIACLEIRFCIDEFRCYNICGDLDTMIYSINYFQKHNKYIKLKYIIDNTYSKYIEEYGYDYLNQFITNVSYYINVQLFNNLNKYCKLLSDYK